MAKLINIHQAAEMLSLNPFTLYKLAQDEKIPSIKIGRLRRFQEEDLKVFIEQHRTGKNFK